MSDTEFELFVMNAGPDILRFCRIIANNKEQGDDFVIGKAGVIESRAK